MKQSVKKRFSAASILVLVGGLIFCIAMTLNGWDFSKLSSARIERRTVEINGEFRNIRIDTRWSDVALFASKDGGCRVEFTEEEKMKHRVTVENGTLRIEQTDTRKWYDYIGLTGFGKTAVRVYLPETEYGALFVKGTTGDITVPAGFGFEKADIINTTGDIAFEATCSGRLCLQITTGDIRVSGTSAAEMELAATTGDIGLFSVKCEGTIRLRVTTGDTDLEDVSCAALDSVGSTGDAHFINVIAGEKLAARRSTGDVRLEYCDAGELILKTGTGDITGSLLSEKVFIARSDTGRIRVPETVTGGTCKVTTDTGDIDLEVRTRKP